MFRVLVHVGSLFSTFLVGLQILTSDAEAGDNSEIKQVVEMYAGQKTAIDAGALATEKPARDVYVAKLMEAERVAAAKAQLKVVTAIVHERQTVSAGKPISVRVPAELPAELEGPRAALRKEIARIRGSFVPKYQAILKGHLATLSAVEAQAQVAKNQELLAAVEVEKRRVSPLLMQTQADQTTAPNAKLLNGDFSQKVASGSPKDWSTDRGGVQVVKLKTESFARFADGRGGQYIAIPKGAKTVELKARVRSADLAPEQGAEKAGAGVGIYSYFADRKQQPLCFCLIKEKSAQWQSLTASGPIPPEATQLRVWMERWHCSEGTVEVDDVQVFFN